MNTRATLLGLTLILIGCGASHDNRSALATPQPTAAAERVHGTAITPRKVVVIDSYPIHPTPAVSFTPWSFVTSRTGASKATKSKPSGVVTPQSGATTAPSAARAAAVESRSSTIPIARDVPAKGVTIHDGLSGGALPDGVPYASEKDPVQIVSYVLSSTIIHPGDKVTGDVTTSSNAASVTAQVGTITIPVPKIAPGKFHLLMQLPSIPLPPGDAKLIITAIRTDGKRTTREVPITVVL